MKHLIKIQTVEHGTLSCIHGGRDGQYAEAGTTIVLDWQPSAGWGLQEAHFIDGAGNVTQINLAAKTFTMPDSPITIVGTFKRFGVQDWTEGHHPHVGAAFVVGINGEPVAQGGNLVSIGSYPNNELPTLNGFEDAGKLAYSTTLRQYVTWDGYGWTYMDGRPIEPRYLKVVTQGAWFAVDKIAGTISVPEGWNIEYSTDGGRMWNTYVIKSADDSPTLVSGTVLFRGVNPNGFYYEQGGNKLYLHFDSIDDPEISGDITSLINGVGGDCQLAPRCFIKMFHGCSFASAPNLPSTQLAERCYEDLFLSCYNLVTPCDLPATTLAIYCYNSMFKDCTKLTSAPALPAVILSQRCYTSMFQNCSQLTKAPELPATVVPAGAYQYMFNGCSGMTEAPYLPAESADIGSGAYNQMFSGCSGVPSYHVMSLNNSQYTFNGNSACASFTIDDETPPTIASSTIYGLKATCVIYVPADSVDAYKAATYWSDRAQYIQAKP